MSWFDYIWPFGIKSRERREAEEEAEKAFREQLEEAKRRQGGLETVVERLRTDRERRRHTSLPSYPNPQEG